MDQTYYELLGVPLDAADTELHARFEARRQELVATIATRARDKRAATGALNRLNKAYSVLSNPARRRAYDARLQRQALADTSLPHRLAGAFARACLSTSPRRVLFLSAVLVGLQLLLRHFVGESP